MTPTAKAFALPGKRGQWGPAMRLPAKAYLGGARRSSKNSSILFTSVLTSPSNIMKGGLVPGARSCRSAGFLRGAGRGREGRREADSSFGRQLPGLSSVSKA